MSELSDALERLARYREKIGDEGVIDEEIGLSARDLDVIITVGGAAALDPGVASRPSAEDVADEMPHREEITSPATGRPLPDATNENSRSTK
jgi:hypothetical protein